MGFKVSGTTIVDQDRQLVNVGGINASAGILTVTNTLKVGTGVTASAGIVTVSTIHVTGGNFGPIHGGSDDETDAALVLDEGQGIYSLESTGGWLNVLLEKQTDIITLGQANTNKIDEIQIIPGKSGITQLYAGDGTATPVGILTTNKDGVTVSGILTATTINATTIKGPGTTDATFIGDGSGLSGVTGTGSGVVIRHDNTLVGTAATIDLSTNLDVTAVSAGVCTITAGGGGADMLEIMLFA